MGFHYILNPPRRLYFILTHIFSGGKVKLNLHTTLKLTVFMLISCLMPSRFLTSRRLRTRHSTRHRLNARKVINWKRNFKENLLTK